MAILSGEEDVKIIAINCCFVDFGCRAYRRDCY
jgi:hypothetical protein